MQTTQTTPTQTPPPQPSQPTPAEPQVTRNLTPPQPVEQRVYNYSPQYTTRYSSQHAAGVPVWGVLLILIGVIALFSNLGIGLGWVFGLALGAWFVYLGVRHMSEGAPANWWLVGLGLLIGLGAISSGFMDKLIFPIVLIIVGLGILGERAINRPN